MPIKLNSTGGGSVSIDVPSTASSYTLTAPARSGTIITSADANTVTQAMVQTGFAGNGPAFSAYQTVSQTGLTSGVVAKITFTAEDFDTANCYDTTTSRFTPNVAGYYQINAAVSLQTAASTGSHIIYVYKNGTTFSRGNRQLSTVSMVAGLTVSQLIYMNGTTDYLEIHSFSNAGTFSTEPGSASERITWFNGYLARSA
jgi:hypothetical protein